MELLKLDWQYRERSRLYSPEPIGCGTGLVEGLASYMSRLAHHHYVSIPDLLRYIASQSDKKMPQAKRWEYALTRGNGRGLNGLKWTATVWSHEISEATQRPNIAQLTLLPWRALVNAKGLNHESQHWCPDCLVEWRQANKKIYWPLVWSFRLMTVCRRHKRQLENRCHVCSEPVSMMATCTLPGNCSKCGTWLGVKGREPQKTVDDTKLRVAEYVMGAVALGDASMKDVTLAKLSQLLHWCQETADCKKVDVALALGLSQHALDRILSQPTGTIPLEMMIHICQHLGVTLDNFALLSFEEFVASGKMQPFVESLPSRICRPKASRLQPGFHAPVEIVEEVGECLKAALQKQRPLPLSQLAYTVGLSTTDVLEKHYPELCKQIRQKRKNWLDEDAVRQCFEEALAKPNERATILQIAEKFGTSYGVLRSRFPEEVAMITARQRIVPDVDDFREKVAGFLKCNPPLTLTSVSEELGIDPQHIRKYCPELGQAIVRRFAVYRREQTEKRHRAESMKVRQLVREVHSQRKYPTKSAVARQLGRPGWDILHPHEQEAFWEVMDELGL